MKKLFTVILILLSFLSYSQKYTPQNRYGDSLDRVIHSKYIGIPTGCGKPIRNNSYDSTRGAIFYDSCNKNFYLYDPKLKLWDTIKGGSGGNSFFNYPAISSLPVIGDLPGNNITTDSAFRYIFYKSQPPLATLTGGGTYEYTTAGNTNRTLSWTATRQTATATLATIVVDGVTQTFTQPAQGGTVSNNKTAIVPHNTNTTYSNIVTTTDGKTATATTTFIYQNKIYAGFVTNATPTDADIIAATGSSYVGGIFSASRNQSGTLTTPSSSKYFIFVSPASYGTPNILINGLGATLNQTTRNFTNASGAIISYIIAVSPFQTSGQIDSYIVN